MSAVHKPPEWTEIALTGRGEDPAWLGEGWALWIHLFVGSPVWPRLQPKAVQGTPKACLGLCSRSHSA